MNTNQSNLGFFDDYIEKVYKNNDINSYSSIEHEIKCINSFFCKYSPQILGVNYEAKSYMMQRYDFAFGSPKGISEKNIKRLLFTLSKEEIFKQLDEILYFLKYFKLNHRDVNPGNLMFSEKEKIIKLIDFYWTNTETITIDTPSDGINQRYGTDDEIAIKRIKNEIDIVYLQVKESIEEIKEIISHFGEVYRDGSSKHKGKVYTKIDIPYFDDILAHRDVEYEYKDLVENLTVNPKILLDIGPANGNNIFKFIRDFSIDKAIGYEADPDVFKFLCKVKETYCLDNLEFNTGVTPETIFPKSDLTICMNVHMWLHKQYGKDCDLIIKNLISSSKEMFFQTAGAESQGMYLVKELTSKEVIYDYLKNLGGNEVEFIRSSKHHGGLRHLFKIKGN